MIRTKWYCKKCKCNHLYKRDKEHQEFLSTTYGVQPIEKFGDE